MRALTELGMKPRRRSPFTPATVDGFEAFEKYWAVILPMEYKAFLQHSNGGRSILREYDDPHGGIGEVNDWYGLGNQSADLAVSIREVSAWDTGNLWGETRIWQPVIGKGVPFGRDGGNNQLYMDFRVSPPLVCRLVNATRSQYKLANSFGDFIDSLRLPTL